MTLQEALRTPLASGRSPAQILLADEGDGLIVLLAMRDRPECSAQDRETISTVLRHPVLAKSLRAALAQVSTV